MDISGSPKAHFVLSSSAGVACWSNYLHQRGISNNIKTIDPSMTGIKQKKETKNRVSTLCHFN